MVWHRILWQSFKCEAVGSERWAWEQRFLPKVPPPPNCLCIYYPASPYPIQRWGTVDEGSVV